MILAEEGREGYLVLNPTPRLGGQSLVTRWMRWGKQDKAGGKSVLTVLSKSGFLSLWSSLCCMVAQGTDQNPSVGRAPHTGMEVHHLERRHTWFWASVPRLCGSCSNPQLESWKLKGSSASWRSCPLCVFAANFVFASKTFLLSSKRAGLKHKLLLVLLWL